MYKCYICGKENNIVNQCGCDKNNMPTKINPCDNCIGNTDNVDCDDCVYGL